MSVCGLRPIDHSVFVPAEITNCIWTSFHVFDGNAEQAGIPAERVVFFLNRILSSDNGGRDFLTAGRWCAEFFNWWWHMFVFLCFFALGPVFGIEIALDYLSAAIRELVQGYIRLGIPHLAKNLNLCSGWGIRCR